MPPSRPAPPARAAAPPVAALTPALTLALTLVTTLVVALGPGASGAAAAATPGTDSSWSLGRQTTLRVLGHGYGHGHGMSQYGAEGAAREGLSHQQILDFYYPGTALGQAGGRVRVWLTGASARALVVRARPGLVVRDDGAERGERRTELPAGPDQWRLRGGVLAGQQDGRWHRFADLQGVGAFSAAGHPVTLLTPAGPRPYRGRLTTTVLPSGQAIVVNRVGLESYLRGVVPQEIPASWSPQAVQAQAVAARTYAVFERYPGNTYYDLCDTGACQVYGGVAAEQPASDAAVTATRHQVLTRDGAPAFTQFGSSSGGWTAAGDEPYLRAVQDPYDGWAGNPVHSWKVGVDPARLESAWPALGRLRSIEVTSRDGNGQWGGRVQTVRLRGTDGTVRVSGETLRSVLGLRSTWFTFRTS